MVLESLRVPNVAGVDIEDVDHDGTLNHVDNGEGQGGESDQLYASVELVSLAVLYLEVRNFLPRQRQEVHHHEGDRQHHLNWGFDTAGYTVGNPGEHLQSGRLHVVVRGWAGEANEPQVDDPANAWDKWIEKQAEQYDQYEVVPSFLGQEKSQTLIILDISFNFTFLIELLTLSSKPKN